MSWSSKKQQIIALLTVEAEYIARDEQGYTIENSGVLAYCISFVGKHLAKLTLLISD